jgi:predicted dehydrogenase
LQAHPAWGLAAVVEPDREARERLEAIHPDGSWPLFPTLDEAYERVGKDCAGVLVATPADAHVQPTRWALQRSLAALVEKPFTVSLRDAVELVTEAEEANVPLLVAQNYRYLRSTRTIRKLLREGACGRIGTVTSHYYTVPHVMAGSLARLEHSVLWGMAVHHLDALRYVLDDRVSAVCATSFSPSWSDLPRGGSLQALLEFEGGTHVAYSATYESSGHEYFENGQEFYQRFVGETATLHVLHRWLVLCPRGGRPRLIRRGRRQMSEEQLLLGEFADACAGNTDAQTSGRDNLATIAICEAVVHSAEQSCWIDPRELLDEFS